MRILSLLLLLAPTTALAEVTVLPELFSVTGVTAKDVLNIRLEPNAKAPIIGSVSPDTKNIEVVEFSENGDWAWINGGESGGWVARRYLQMQPSIWKNGALPASLSCVGTEPFWNITFADGKATLDTPDTEPKSYQIEHINDRGFAEDRIRAVQAGALTAVIVPQQCSDGMSDRRYALQAIVSLREGDRPMLAGCCSITPR